MAAPIKTQTAILEKLNIPHLNDMQEKAIAVIDAAQSTVLLSPTGTGKTIAFLLPVLKCIQPNTKGVQALILVPSRELAIQIEQVLRDMGTGYKVNAVYGGRSAAKDREELQHPPSILIGTPGRVSDHVERHCFSLEHLHTVVLDEFDKSLEVGFEKEMRTIMARLNKVSKHIVTSATDAPIPAFVGLRNPEIVNCLHGESAGNMYMQTVMSPSPDKTQTLVDILRHIGNERVIIFCSLKKTIGIVANALARQKVSYSCFSGGMEQRDRERSLIKFRNGTSNVLVATDLAARGIDIPEMEYLIHFEMPDRVAEFTHRNGRTARAGNSGSVFIVRAEHERVPDFIEDIPVVQLSQQHVLKPSAWQTLFLSGGRKDKISKGDIAGLFFKQGNLQKEQLGAIELKQDCAFVAVPTECAAQLIKKLNNTRLKNKKTRITVV